MPRSAASRRSVAGPHTHEKESEEPVRLTRTQWMDMLKYEDAEEAVAELMERFLNKVMDECFKVDIRQKLIPYTANWVKNDLIQIVEQRFLCRDEGDEEVLSEDSAVVPTEPDAWAQGCVPLIITSTPLQPIPPKGDVHKDAAPKEVEMPMLNPGIQEIINHNKNVWKLKGH
uniref:Uncharacterized protein n=1 Tax=Knipowitschia caucasica TaxID=637954 RepID=A0AAV2KXW0_KNICA